MLTKLEQRILDLVLLASCKMYVFPLDWKVYQSDGTKKIEKTFQPTKSKTKIFGVFLNLGISLGYEFFLIYQLLPASGAYSKKELSDTFTFELMIHYFLTSIHATSCIIQYFGIKYTTEFSWFYNQLVGFNRKCGKSQVYIFC